MTCLNELFLSNNQIAEILPLETLTSLNELYIDSNQIDDITPISSLSKLKGLDISGNDISDVHALEPLNLGWLNLSNNPLSRVSSLLKLKNLWWLSISGTDVCEVMLLGQMEKLKFLAVNNLSLTTEQLDALQKTLPDCLITCDDEIMIEQLFPWDRRWNSSTLIVQVIPAG